MFQTLVEELREWMSSTLGKHTIASAVEAYLSKRGHDTMVSCLHGDCDELRYVAECSDRLGWDSLVKGRITHHWLDLVKPILQRRGSWMPESSWGCQFITRLHNVLHRQ
jgi:hypothetical protein